MAKSETLGVRFEPSEINALKAAAAVDDRAVSALVRKITVEWLRVNGWLELPDDK